MKICFCSAFISSSLKGNTPGGAELQIALLAKALAKDGHEVVIIDPYAPESFVSEDGIKLINVPNWNKGIKGIRAFVYRIPGLYKVLKAQKADYYYVRMRHYLNLLSYLAAKKVKGKFIMAFASDIDPVGIRKKFKLEYKKNFSLSRYISIHLPNDIVYKLLLKRCDYIFMQHKGQDTLSVKTIGKKALFGNIIDLNILPTGNNFEKEYFVYAGSLSILKGADKLYELSQINNKKYSIVVVGQPNDHKSKIIFEQLKEADNIILKGRLAHYDTVQLIAHAKALINTSDYEGFPNVFLEAWAMGVPVLSLKVNPGNIFNETNLGVCFEGDLNKMKECIGKNETQCGDKKEMIAYINNHHDFKTAAARFIKILHPHKLLSFFFLHAEYYEPCMLLL